MTSCIYYHPEAYTTSGPKLMGRNAAGESFLRGFIDHSKTSEFWIQVEQPGHENHFVEKLRHSGREEPVKIIDRNNLSALSHPGNVYYPGPNIGSLAFNRSGYGNNSWSICGITHTTSSASAMDSIADLVTAPIQPWDALICTSTAVKNNVERILQAQVDYLKERLGITKIVLPKLPVIPLGIHTEDFKFTAEQRSTSRNALDVSEDTIVVLYMGRLSFHAKAHPLAMYQALERAAQNTGRDIVLIECGWHANEYSQNAYFEAAQNVCPSIRVVTLDGRLSENRQKAWASADIFCSLSDNIQETFGITPIEAMAAGLPVVVSDWDGYKDTVRDGIDGYRIPTLMPHSGLGIDLSQRHAMGIDTYDYYCGYTSSLIAVDIEAATQAFASLIKSPERRHKMGTSGKKRARGTYDWGSIIPQYEDLWHRQNELRKSSVQDIDHAAMHSWPARLDPFYSFAGYPSQILSQDTILGLTDQNVQTAVDRLRAFQRLNMVSFAKTIIPTDEELSLVLTAASKPQPALDLVSTFKPERQAFVFRSLSWLLKLGLLKAIS